MQLESPRAGEHETSVQRADDQRTFVTAVSVGRRGLAPRER